MSVTPNTDTSATDTLQPLSAELTYGATLDVRNVEHEITEMMIRRACVQMDEEQQFPFCASGNDKVAAPCMRRVS